MAGLGIVLVEGDLLLERPVPEGRTREVEHDTVGLHDAGEARRVDSAQASPDRLDEGALVQHRAQDADATDGLAVEAFGQDHAVRQHLHLAPVEPGDEVGARPRWHVAGDCLGRDARGAESLGHRIGMVDRRAEEDAAPVRRLCLPMLDDRLVQHRAVQHLVGCAHVEVASGGAEPGELVLDAEIYGVGARRHQETATDQRADLQMIADIAEGAAEAAPIAATRRGREPEQLDLWVERAGVVDDSLIALSGRAVAFVDDKMRDRRHPLAPVGARQGLDAAEDDAAAPVVLLGLDHRGWHPGDSPDSGPVLVDQLIGVLQHQDPVVFAVLQFLADVETGDGGLARPGRQDEHGVAMGGGAVAGGIDRRPLIIARDHDRPPQRAHEGAEPEDEASGWAPTLPS